MRLKRLGQLKNPVTSSGIETATFQLVAKCLNQLRYCVCLGFLVLDENYFSFYLGHKLVGR
jgi:hypothetical protein